MKRTLLQTAQIIGLMSLLFLVLPPFLFLNGNINLDQVKWIMLAATLFWFISASYRMIIQE